MNVKRNAYAIERHGFCGGLVFNRGWILGARNGAVIFLHRCEADFCDAFISAWHIGCVFLAL